MTVNSSEVKFFVVFHQISSHSLKSVINYYPHSLSLSRSGARRPYKSLYLSPSHSLNIALPGFSDSLPLSPFHFFFPENKRFQEARFLQWRVIILPPFAPLSTYSAFLPVLLWESKKKKKKRRKKALCAWIILENNNVIFHPRAHTMDTQTCRLSKVVPIFISHLECCVQMNQSKLLTCNLVTRRVKHTTLLITANVEPK